MDGDLVFLFACSGLTAPNRKARIGNLQAIFFRRVFFDLIDNFARLADDHEDKIVHGIVLLNHALRIRQRHGSDRQRQRQTRVDASDLPQSRSSNHCHHALSG
jgi:hypothetical protein